MLPLPGKTDNMPKQVQYTKEDIINASIEVLRSQGPQALTARTVGAGMGCSVAPIFRAFSNMEELLDGVKDQAQSILRSYIEDSVYYRPAFKEFGMRLIRFAINEPNLFHFLFLDKGSRNSVADEVAKECLKQTAMDYNLTLEQTDQISDLIWPYSCGLAQLCSNNPGKLQEEKISTLLTTQFMALLLLVKSDKDVPSIEPYLLPDSDKIYLRKWRETDADALYELAKDPELGPRAGWPAHQNVEESLEVIKRFFLNSTTWAIILKDTGEIVGCAGFHTKGASNMPLESNEAEVGYWIARPYWNQGLCTKALNIVIEHCRNTGKYTTLYGEHFTDNPASGRVMEKCGFSYTGQTRTCPGLQIGSNKEVRVLKKDLSSNQ